MSKSTILVIEDDDKVRKFMVTTLSYGPYNVIQASTGGQGITLINANNPDVILLDLGLPDMDGKEIIVKTRLTSSIPIIIISARSENQEKVEALDAGADDYLTKPFSVEELEARIRVSLRRSHPTLVVDGILRNGNLQINTDTGIVNYNNTEIHVTPIEYKLLELLMRNQDKVLSYNVILKEVWGLYSDNVPALRVFVRTLRKKIEDLDPDNEYIQTHVGVGYRMIKKEDSVNF